MKPIETLAKLLYPKWDYVVRTENYRLREVPGGFVNLTPYEINDQMAAILSYGPRFLLPKRTGAMEIFDDLGQLHLYLHQKYGHLDPTNVFAELFAIHRQELISIFEDHIPSIAETAVRDACEDVYNFFRTYKDSCIVQADKGNITCLMTKRDYMDKMDAYVTNCILKGVYLKAKSKDEGIAITVFKRLRDDIVRALRTVTQQAMIPTDLLSALVAFRVNEAVLPHLYGTVKSHKVGTPMRPICSSVNWVSRPIQKLLLHILSTVFAPLLCKQNVTRIDDVARELGSLRLKDGYVFVKMDVTDMYGSMNKTKIAQTLRKLLNHPSIKSRVPFSIQLIERMFHFSMEHACLVSYNGENYRQVRGLPQGACDSGFLATLQLDSLLQVHNDELFVAHHVYKWWKYMDDVLLCIPEKYVDSFKRTFEHITELKLEVDGEEPIGTHPLSVHGVIKTLSFLDIQINRMENGSLAISRYTKPTASKRMIHALSSTLLTYKTNTIKGFINKILRRTSTCFLETDLNSFYEQALFNGYPPTLLDSIYHDVLCREINDLKQGQCFLSMSIQQMKERYNVLESILPDFPQGGKEIIEEIRRNHVSVTARSRSIFPYRSVALSHIIRMGCAYGGMVLPVYSRLDQSGAFSRFFGKRTLGRISHIVDTDRRRFHVGLVWCVTCGLVFIISGKQSLDHILETEMERHSSAVYKHHKIHGHTISPIVRPLRPIKGVDASYINTVYSAIFSSVGISCSNHALLSQVPYFIRGLLGYMQGYGDQSPTPRIMSPERSIFMSDGDILAPVSSEASIEAPEVNNISIPQMMINTVEDSVQVETSASISIEPPIPTEDIPPELLQ